MSVRFPLIAASFLVVCLLVPGPAGADPVADLYAADVPVTDQSASTRENALREALAQVLVKVTGSRGVLETAEARDLLANAGRYLQQYRYQAIRPRPDDPDAPSLALHAEFDGVTLERRLRNAQLPLWGRERPLTLAWVALNGSGERRLVGTATEDELSGALHRFASQRGLPLKLPLMDTEDATRLSFMDVWGVFEEPLQNASRRYRADAVLAGSIFSAGNDLWAGRWTLLQDGERHRWEVNGDTPGDVASAAIDALAEHYASRYAVYAPPGGDDRALMEVRDVAGLEAYSRVQAYLDDLSMVEELRLFSVDNDVLRFELKINGTVRSLEQAIALGQVLEALPPRETPFSMNSAGGLTLGPDPAAVPAVEPVEERVLRYRYRSPSSRQPRH